MGSCPILVVPETLEEMLSVCRLYKVSKISITNACVTVDFEPAPGVAEPQPMGNTQIEVDPLFWSAQ